MSIKITETMERDCCERVDLKEYKGRDNRIHEKLYFCKHCGQYWYYEKYTDAAGSSDTRLQILTLKL